MVRARWIGLFVLLVVGMLLLALPASAQRVVRLSLPTFRPFQWKPGTELSYAIKDTTGKRIGTAYYKVVKASPEYGAGMWELRYMAQGPNLSESSVVVFDPEQLVPLRTTRKIVAAGETTYWIVDYLPNRIVVTRRRGDRVKRYAYPKSGPVYDYEQVMFLLPLAEPRPDVRYYLPLYHTGDRGVLMTYWNPVGEEVVVSGDRAWQARKLSYQVGMVTQYLWLADINGRTEVVKYDTGVGTIFVALDLPGNTEVPPDYKEPPLQLKPPLEIKVKKRGEEGESKPSPSPGGLPGVAPPRRAEELGKGRGGTSPSPSGPRPAVGPRPELGTGVSHEQGAPVKKVSPPQLAGGASPAAPAGGKVKAPPARGLAIGPAVVIEEMKTGVGGDTAKRSKAEPEVKESPKADKALKTAKPARRSRVMPVLRIGPPPELAGAEEAEKEAGNLDKKAEKED